MKLSGYLSLFASIPYLVLANTEKVIFVAPDPGALPDSLQALQIDTIIPTQPVSRKSLPVAFPNDTRSEDVQGRVSWYLVTQLNPGQRYEIRICWAAIQPTEFSLDIFEARDFSEDPTLLQHLLQYNQHQSGHTPIVTESIDSHLLLRVASAADFYTTNKSLMRNPPPVDVDIILDPFIANVFPASLLPVAGYIVLLAVISWPVSQFVWNLLQPRSSVPTGKTRKD